MKTSWLRFLLTGLCGTFVTISLAHGEHAAASKKPLPKAGDFVEVEDSGDTEASGKKSDVAKPEGSSSAGKSSTKADVKSGANTENEKALTGTVRVVRKIEYTEVFFKDIGDSYVIPSGNSYSSIYKAMIESQKKGTPVRFRANTKSRRVLSIEEPDEGAASANSGSSSSPAASVK